MYLMKFFRYVLQKGGGLEFHPNGFYNSAIGVITQLIIVVV